MRRKLLVLDFALAGLLFYAGWQLRSDWLAARAREAVTMHQRVRIAAPPLFTPLPAAPPVAAS
ncbi:MAG TPA: hypothetical protein VJ732_09125, partial [Bryobacteraceae bacterium]|nr:hypothetical protein [Bryobacteraceae bacterium]